MSIKESSVVFNEGTHFRLVQDLLQHLTKETEPCERF